MIEKIIASGDKIDIEVIDPNTREKHIYRSQVFDILDNDQLRIAMPFVDTKLIVLSLNVRYKLCFHTQMGLFECVGHVIDRFKSDNRYIAVVTLKTGLRKIQRREFYRLERLTDLQYRLLSQEEAQCETVRELLLMEEEAVEGPVYKSGIAVDLSGGGARLLTDEQYSVPEYLVIKLHIDVAPEQSEFYVIGKIVLSEKLAGKSGQYENRVEFVRMEEPEREKLIHYIFKEERKLRRIRKS